MKQVCTRRARDFSLEAIEEEKNLVDDEHCTVGGMITGINRRITKKNDMMAFVTLEDNTGSMEVVVFPKTYELTEELIQEDRKVFVYGRVQMSDEANGKLIAEKIIAFENFAERNLVAIFRQRGLSGEGKGSFGMPVTRGRRKYRGHLPSEGEGH